MSLEHPNLEPFEPILSRVMELAFTMGIRALHSAGYKMEDIKHNSSARNRFMRSCHYGYDRAQQRIGVLVSKLQCEIDEKKRELKVLRRRRDKDGIKAISNFLVVLNNRQLILRRILDTILWTLLQRETWILKRFIVEHRIRPTDPKVVSKTVKIASEWNKASRYRFYLVSDLTTFCQIGDLVGIDLTEDADNRWTVIELKEGKMNEVLSGLIEGQTEPLSDKTYEQIGAKLGKQAARQAKRMVSQQNRMKELWNFVHTDKGIDPLLKEKLQLTPGPPTVTEGYEEELRNIIDRSSRDGFGSTTIDHCLHLFAGTSDFLESKISKDALKHVFFHMANPDLECKLSKTGEEYEIALVDGFTPPIDLIAANVRALWGHPFFAWPLERERTIDLAMGRIRVFCFFDTAKFFEIAKGIGLKVSWVTEKEDNRVRRMSHPIPGSPNALGVKVEHDDGTSLVWLSGLFARAINEQMRPKQLLQLMYVRAAESQPDT